MTRRILQSIQLDKIAAVDRPCQEHAVVAIMKREATPDNLEKSELDILKDRIMKDLVLLPMVSPEPDDDSAFDFSTALEEVTECDRWCDVHDELRPYVHAMKHSLISIVTDPKLAGDARTIQMSNTVSQFLDAVKSRYADAIPAMSEAIATKRLRKLRTTVLNGKLALLKSKMAKWGSKSSAGGHGIDDKAGFKMKTFKPKAGRVGASGTGRKVSTGQKFGKQRAPGGRAEPKPGYGVLNTSGPSRGKGPPMSARRLAMMGPPNDTKSNTVDRKRMLVSKAKARPFKTSIGIAGQPRTSPFIGNITTGARQYAGSTIARRPTMVPGRNLQRMKGDKLRKGTRMEPRPMTKQNYYVGIKHPEKGVIHHTVEAGNRRGARTKALKDHGGGTIFRLHARKIAPRQTNRDRIVEKIKTLALAKAELFRRRDLYLKIALMAKILVDLPDAHMRKVIGNSAGDYIDDFVHSSNKRFDGKSKEERIRMALGAYYGSK